MPAGSGPAIAQVTSVVLPANTTENVLITLPPGNWNNQTAYGALLTFAALFTGAAAGTLTFRIRQGTTNAGTLVGTAVAITAANGVVVPTGMEFQDTSAFGLGPTAGGQYVLTYQQSAVSLGTINSALLEFETTGTISLWLA